MASPQGQTLQTLDRGLFALSMVARSSNGVTVAEIAKALGVHRAIAYRIVATLAAHGMIARAHDGRLYLGGGVPALAEHFMPQFKALATPVLRQLAQATGSTSFVALAEGSDCVAILVEEPDGPLLRVGYRVGSRHPLERGAAGIAILSGRPARSSDPEAVREARTIGYSLTQGQLQAGAVGIASPLSAREGAGWPDMSIGVVAMQDLDVEAAATLVIEKAAALVDLLTGGSGPSSE